ncbi:MAG: hypothetical protein AAF585_10010 [Verrucomicrobiota bacterium]
MKLKFLFLPAAVAAATFMFGGMTTSAVADEGDDYRYRGGRYYEDDDYRYRNSRYRDDDYRYRGRYDHDDDYRYRRESYHRDRDWHYDRAEYLRDEWIRDQRRYYGGYGYRGGYCPH